MSALHRIAALLALVAALAALLVPGGVGAPASARVTSYVDQVGDSKGPLDIRLVDIIIQPGNVMRMSVTVPNSPKINPGQVLGVQFDTDRNTSTGSSGYDFRWAIQGNDDGSASFTAYKWTNGAWEKSFLKSYDSTPWANGDTVSFGLSELGSTSFRFFAYTKQFDGSTWDWAPSSGSWSFTLSSPKPKPKPVARLVVGAASLSPSTGPRSGLPFYVAPSVKRVDPATGQRTGIPFGVVTCAAHVGTRHLTAIMHRISPGKGVICGWNVPSGTGGRTLSASVQVRSAGLRASKAYSWRIK